MAETLGGVRDTNHYAENVLRISQLMLSRSHNARPD